MMGEHILVAEDEADIRDLLVLALGSAGYRVETATDGRVALERAMAFPPRLLITDLRMPEMDGLDLIRAMRDQPSLSQIPVILFTAFVITDQRVENARKFDRVEIVTKGQLADLRRAVQNVIDEGAAPATTA